MQEAGDILASEVSPWHFMENVAIELAELYGYQEARTPLFEEADLFAQGMGSSSGFVENDLWMVNDKRGHRLAVRGNMLLPVTRALSERSIAVSKNGEPQKFYYLGSVFAHSKGRDQVVREGHRFGVEAIGSTLPSLDVEVIMLAYDFFNSLGLSDLKLQLNSLGCKKCRPEYQQALYDYFSRRSSELCPRCRRRHRTHPLWTMGCEAPQCRALAQVAPSIFGYLCPECRDNFEAVRNYLSELKVPYRLTPLLVPDVECCNRTIYRITSGDKLLSFGGRCDELSRMLGGSDFSAVGGSVDLDETLAAIREANLVPELKREVDVCLGGSNQEAVALLLPVLYALRRAGIYAELAYPTSPESNAFETASRSDAKFVIYLDGGSLRQRIVRFREYSAFRDTRLDDAVRRIGHYFNIENLASELRPVEVRKFAISRRQPGSMRQSYEIFEPSNLNKQKAESASKTESTQKATPEENSRPQRRTTARHSSEKSANPDQSGPSKVDETEVKPAEVISEQPPKSSAIPENFEDDSNGKDHTDYETVSSTNGNARRSVRSRRQRTASENGEESSSQVKEKVRAQILALTSAVDGVMGDPRSNGAVQDKNLEDVPTQEYSPIQDSSTSTDERNCSNSAEKDARNASRSRHSDRTTEYDLPSPALEPAPAPAETADTTEPEELPATLKPVRHKRRSRHEQSASPLPTIEKLQPPTLHNEEQITGSDDFAEPLRYSKYSGPSAPFFSTEVPQPAPKAEIDAIAEISASSQGLNEEQIAATLAIPEVNGQEFLEVDEPKPLSPYQRRFNNGGYSATSEDEVNIDKARKGFDRALSVGRGRHDDNLSRHPKRTRTGSTSATSQQEAIEPTAPRRSYRSRSNSELAQDNYNYRMGIIGDNLGSSYSEQVRGDYIASSYGSADTYDEYRRYYSQQPEDTTQVSYSNYETSSGIPYFDQDSDRAEQLSSGSAIDSYLAGGYRNRRASRSSAYRRSPGTSRSASSRRSSSRTPGRSSRTND